MRYPFESRKHSAKARMHPLRRQISIWMTFREVYSRFEGLISTFLEVYFRFKGLIYAKTLSTSVDISMSVLRVSSFDSPLKRR